MDGIAPNVVDDWESCRAAVESEGAAIYDNFQGDAKDVPRLFLGEMMMASMMPTAIQMKKTQDGSAEAITWQASLSSATHVKHGSEGSKRKTSNEIRDVLHVDGAKALGYQHPDFIFLVCEAPCKEGLGANFLVRGDDVMARIRASVDDAWVADRLERVEVDQLYYSVTAAGKGMHRGKLVTKLEMRTIFQCPNVFDAGEQRVHPLPGSEDIDLDQKMIEIFARFMRDAQDKAPRFTLKANQILIADNYRLSHGREPFADLDRKLWRVWAWSKRAGFGLPSNIHAGQNEIRDCEI